MYDVIIIGGGPAGLTAGMYACRSGLETVLYEAMFPGGQLAKATSLENVPGFSEGISGRISPCSSSSRRRGSG